MFTKKGLLSICMLLSPVLCAGEVYHAGETAPAGDAPTAKWEVSAGVVRTNNAAEDAYSENFFSSQRGISVRGLYQVNHWLAAGAEGSWFSAKDLGPTGTLRFTRYGLLTRWTLTPHMKPSVYALLGGGVNQHKLHYAGMWGHTKSGAYGLLGLGVEVPVYRTIFLAAEIQGVYNFQRRLDDFARLSHRLERQMMLRGGVRF